MPESIRMGFSHTAETPAPRSTGKLMPALVVIFGAALISLITSCSATKPLDQPEPAARSVPLETVAASTVSDYYEAAGTVRSKTSSVLSAKVMGTIIAVHVKEGDRVRAGQLLIEIDSRDAQAQLEKATAAQREAEDSLIEIERSTGAAAASLDAAAAARDLAEATYRRYQVLLDRRSVSPQEFDEVETRYKTAVADAERAAAFRDSLRARMAQAQARIEEARAEVRAAQVTLAYFRITSPMDGTVTAKQAEPGSTASPGTPLLTVEDDSRYRLEVAAEDSQAGKIKVGDAVQVFLDVPEAASITGNVAELVRASDPSSRSFTVKIELASAGRERVQSLRSGMYGKARFAIGSREAITVPSAAVVERGQLTAVYSVDDSGRTRLRLIKTGRQFGDRVEVLSGIVKGDRIVTGETGSIDEGIKVVVPAQYTSRNGG